MVRRSSGAIDCWTAVCSSHIPARVICSFRREAAGRLQQISKAFVKFVMSSRVRNGIAYQTIQPTQSRCVGIRPETLR